MKTPTTLLFLLILATLAMAPRAASAQTVKQDSVKITYVFATDTETYTSGNQTFIVCRYHVVGTHPDPKGNGRDSDYIYKFDTGNVFVDGRAGPTPPEWTGMSQDIPGELITFSGTYGGGTRNVDVGCDAIFANGESILANFEAKNLHAHFFTDPNKRPVALFTHEVGEGLYTVDFDASGSYDEDGSVVAYEWTIDGETITSGGPTLTHTFPKRGTYSVRLVVEDNDGDDSLPVTSTVNVKGPDLGFTLEYRKHRSGSAKVSNSDDVITIGDTVRVHVVVTNTGDLDVENISLSSSVSVKSDVDGAFVLLESVTPTIGSLNKDETDTLRFVYRASKAAERVDVQIDGLSGRALLESGGSEPFEVEASACGVQAKPVSLESTSVSCVNFAIQPAPLVVNSTGDAGLAAGLSEDDGCSTGGSVAREGVQEPECTLRAALEFAIAMEGDFGFSVEFDIPGETFTRRIVLENGALPPVDKAVSILGGTQPGAEIEIDGSGLSGSGPALMLGSGGNAAVVEGLSFFRLPGRRARASRHGQRGTLEQVRDRRPGIVRLVRPVRGRDAPQRRGGHHGQGRRQRGWRSGPGG
jgi:uncharacterized repeat protein (TIGR01451 family)